MRSASRVTLEITTYQSLPAEMGGSHINVKEICAVMVAAMRWFGSWRNSSVVFVMDSAVVEAALNSGRLKGVMDLLHQLFWISVEY